MASIKHLVDIDLNKNQLTNVKLQHISGNPSGSGEDYEGRIFYDSSANAVKFHNGTDFIAVGTSNASGDMTSVTLTGGDGIGATNTNSASGDFSSTISLDASLTTVTSMLNSSLVVGRDSTDQIKFSTNDQIIFRVGNADGVIFKASGEIEAASLDISGNVDIDGTLETDALSIASTAVTATAAELNILDGVTSTTAELNILDGVTATAAELNILDGVTSTAAELNILDGVTATASELNILDGVTSTASELNILDGVTSTASELNLLDGSTAGTVVASKAVVVDGNKDIASFRNITLTGELDAGSLDVSGDVDIDGTLEADAITVNGTALNTVIAGVTSTNATNAAHVLITDNESTNENNQIAFIENAAGGTANRGLEADGDFTYNPNTGTLSVNKISTDSTAGFGGNIGVSGTVDVTGSYTVGEVDILSGGLVTSLGTITQDTVTFTSANSDDPVLQIKNTNNSAGSQARLHLVKDRGAAAVQLDDIGSVKFIGENDAQQAIDYGEIFVEIAGSGGAADTDEAGVMALKVATSDGSTSGLRAGISLEGSTSANTVSVALGSGSGSTTTIAGNLVVTGTTTTVNSTTVNLNDHNIVLDSGNTTSAVVNGAGITLEGGSGDDATFTYSTTGPQFEMKLGSNYEDLQVAKLTASSLDISGDVDVDGTLETDALSINGTAVSSTAAELNILDGVTATASELNIMDGVTATTSELNKIDGFTGDHNDLNYAKDLRATGVTTTEFDKLDGLTASTAELNKMDGVTATTSELNILDGVTSTASELNILDGVTATASELNILDGVTATTSEINLIDGGTARGTDAISNGDGLLVNDGGTMKMTNVSKLADLFAGTNISASSSVLSVANGAVGTKGVVTLASTSEALAGSSSSLAVTPAGLAARSFKDEIGDGSTTAITVNHALGTRDVLVQLYDSSTYETVVAQVVRTDTANITVTFNTAPGANSSATPPSIICMVTKID